jgi:ankyrin repeat protein
MKHLLLTTIAAVVLVGCVTSQSPEPTTAKAPDISIHEAAANGNIEAVKQHIAAGADVNAKNNWGWTPLYYAAWVGHKEVAELLIANGADVNKEDDDESTPLHYAALKGQKEIAELLIAKGADMNAVGDLGRTPLDLAYAEIADLLRKHGGKTGEELKAEGK